MNKSFLAAIIVGCTLSACSSKPSDLRPNNKVSLDQVAPGTRDTDIYNLDGANPDTRPEVHGATGHGNEHGAAPGGRKDVMLNHDEHKSDIGGTEPVPAKDKANNADSVENHQ